MKDYMQMELHVFNFSILRSIAISISLAIVSIAFWLVAIPAPISAASQLSDQSFSLPNHQMPSISVTQSYTTYLPIINATQRITVYIPFVRAWGSNYVFPGFYPQQTSCPIDNAYYDGNVIGKMKWCVVSVQVYDNGQMRFDLTWTATYVEPGYYFWKYSDANNPLMNVGDDLGNRYYHIATGGAAAQIVYFYNKGDSYSGWFLFPQPNRYAQTFTFYADDQHQKISNIILHP